MYPVATLNRNYEPDWTPGTLTLPSGEELKTLENPWRNNEPNVSCIRAGVYLCRWLERSASGKYRRCWVVLDVPGRSGILFHPGNLVRHTWGCILPGMKHGVLESQPAVLSSGRGMNAMRGELAGLDFILVIR